MEPTAQKDSATTRRERLEPTGGLTSLERQLLVKPPQRPGIAPVPRSNVLGRLQDFLPKLQAANQQLEERLQTGAATAADVDIESIQSVQDGGDAPVIQMDLACGLFDIRDSAALAAAERAMAAGPGGGDGGTGSGSGSDSDSDSSGGSGCEGGGGGEQDGAALSGCGLGAGGDAGVAVTAGLSAGAAHGSSSGTGGGSLPPAGGAGAQVQPPLQARRKQQTARPQGAGLIQEVL